LFLAGIAAGLMNAIAGGGTIVTFPALLLTGLSSIHANATSTIALLPGTLAGIFGYRRNIPAVYRWLKLFTTVSLIGGLIGGVLLTRTPAPLFDRLVPYLILFATILFAARDFFVRLFRSERTTAARDPSLRWKATAVAFQFVVALYGGYFGAGIGILMLATLGFLGFKDIHEMNTVKGVLGLAINVIAAAYFIFAGLVDWKAAGLVAVGSVLGGYSGAWLAQRIPQRTVRHLVSAIGFTIAAAMFYKQLA
jgi:uncharacterized membrane protein YfcA